MSGITAITVGSGYVADDRAVHALGNRSITPEDIIRDAAHAEVGRYRRAVPAGFAGEFIADKFGLDRQRSWHKTRFGCQQKYKSFIKDKEPPSQTLHFTVITIEAEFIYENNK